MTRVLPWIVVAVTACWPAATTVHADPVRARRPDIIVITGDTTRRDLMGFYGSGVSATPVLDRLSRESYVFERFVSASNNTSVSFASLHTGLPMRRHGVAYLAQFGYRLAPHFRTIAEVLDGSGYLTAAAVSVFHLNPEISGFGRGFEVFVDCDGEDVRRADRTNDALFARLAPELADADRDQPLFLWIHYFDAHFPYAAPEPYAGMFDGMQVGMGTTAPDAEVLERKVVEDARYAGEVRYMDSQIGRLLSWLDARGRLENAVIIFTADHGENLGEHRLYANHNRLYRPVTEVPLFLKLPGKPGGVVSGALAHTTDLMPTILGAADLEDALPDDREGRDLWTVLSEEAPEERAVFSEGRSHLEKMIVRGNRKLTYRFSPHVPEGQDFELYDLAGEPTETRNLYRADDADAASLREELGRFIGTRAVTLDIGNPDGRHHRVEGFLRPLKGGRILNAQGELGGEGWIRTDASGDVRFGARIGRENPDSVRVGFDLDWAAAVAFWGRVDGRPVYRRELAFDGVDNSDMAVRMVFLFEDAIEPEPSAGDEPAYGFERGSWFITRETIGATRSKVVFEHRPSLGAPDDAEFSVIVHHANGVSESRCEPASAASVETGFERVLIRGQGHVRVELTIEGSARYFLATLASAERASGPDEVVTGPGFFKPEGWHGPGVLYSPWFSLRRRAEGGREDEHRPAYTLFRFGRDSIGGAIDPTLADELDAETRARLEALGYVR